MVERHWEDLRGRQLQYRDDLWELTGDVDVRECGDLLAVAARRVEDVRHGSTRLCFDLRDPPTSLNPGDVGEHFDRLERVDGEHHLVVTRPGRTYRYVLHRLEVE
jgi:hypothetical protein